MKRLFLLFSLFLIFLSALPKSSNAQQVVNGNQSFVPGAWVGTQVPNASVTGTTLNSIALINSSGQAIISATSNTTGMAGIVVSGAGTSGNATIAQTGQTVCNFDSGGATAGHFVINSTSVAGDCADGGATIPSVQVFGYVVSGGAGAGQYSVMLSVGNVGTSVGVPCVTTANSLQYNNSGVLGCAAGITTPDGNSLDIKGPIPFVDLSTRARAINNFGGCNAFATISLSTPTTVGLSNNTCFQNGDGITIWGAGATNSMSTPGAPTVIPASLSTGGTGLGGGNYASITTVQGSTGSSTWNYRIIARDKFGGHTAVSSSGTTTTGLSSLGTFNCAVSSYSRSNLTMTINFSSACEGDVVGAMMYLAGMQTGGVGFGGFYNILTSSGGGTVATVTGPLNSTSFGWYAVDVAATPNSGTGGTAYFISSNHLNWTAVTGAWEYFVCREGPGDSNYYLVGTTKPSTTIAEDIQFDDYGKPFMNSQTYPGYIEFGSDTPNSNDAICNSGTAFPDPLTTTVTAGGGTTTLTVANAASNATSGSSPNYALLDAGPGLLAAANSVANSSGAAGELLIPYGKYWIINSYTQLPANLKIKQAGYLVLNEPIELQGGTTWDGLGASVAQGQFPYTTPGSSIIYDQNANPAFYIGNHDQVKVQNATFDTNGARNGGVMIVDDAWHGEFENNNFILGGGNDQDYLAMALVLRGMIPSEDANFTIKGIQVGSSAPTLTSAETWTPFIFFPAAQSSGSLTNSDGRAFISDASFNYRGILQETASGGVNFTLRNFNRQGGVMPLLWVEGSGFVTDELKLEGINLDTDGEGILSVGANNGSCSSTVTVDAFGLSDTGGPTFTGCGPAEYNVWSSQTTTLPNATGVSNSCANPFIDSNHNVHTIRCNFEPNALIGPNAEIYVPMSAPTGPTATAAAGGSLPASGTYQFQVTAVGIDGHESVPSLKSSSFSTSSTCPSSGSCEGQFSWTAILGAVSYNVYVCGLPGNGACNIAASRVATGITGTSYTFTTTNQNLINPPPFSTTGISGITSAQIWAPGIACPETTAPSGIGGWDQLYCDSTNHALSRINGTNAATPLASFTGSLTASDCVNIASITLFTLADAGGKCAFLTVTPTSGDCVTWSGTAGGLGDSGSPCGAGGGGLNTNMNNMANPTAMSQSLIPGAVNTVAIGSLALPITNWFIGTVANQTASANTANLTANRTINIPDATSSPVRDCPAVTNKFMTAEAVATGSCTQSFISASAATPPSYVADSGAVNAYVATLSPAIAAYSAGLVVRFLPANANTTTNPTLNVNGVGAVTITKFGTNALVANDLVTTQIAVVIYDGTNFELQNPNTVANVVTASSTNTFTNKTINAESTGNSISIPVKAFFPAAGCNNSTAANAMDLPSTNAATPQCGGSTVTKGYLQFVRGNVAYINFHLPPDWNSSASTDIELGLTTTDTTNGHVISFNVQTGCAAVTGANTDDPSLNASQAASFTIGASQVSGGVVTFKLTGMAMTGCAADDIFEIVLTRNNSGTDTATNALSAASLKFAELTIGVIKNGTNR